MIHGASRPAPGCCLFPGGPCCDLFSQHVEKAGQLACVCTEICWELVWCVTLESESAQVAALQFVRGPDKQVQGFHNGEIKKRYLSTHFTRFLTNNIFLDQWISWLLRSRPNVLQERSDIAQRLLFYSSHDVMEFTFTFHLSLGCFSCISLNIEDEIQAKVCSPNKLIDVYEK